MIKLRVLSQCLSVTFLVFSLVFFSAKGAETPEHQFDQNKMEDYRHSPAFDYTQDYVGSGSFISILLAYLLNKLSSFFDSPIYGWLGPIILRILLIGAIIAAVLVILRLKFGPVLEKKSGKLAPSAFIYTSSGHEDYQKLLQESIRNNQFKLAIRYLFLHTLGILETQKKIQLKHWKVPYDYLNELPENQKGYFKALADLFETSWYGDYDPDHEAVNEGLRLCKNLENA